MKLLVREDSKTITRFESPRKLKTEPFLPNRFRQQRNERLESDLPIQLLWTNTLRRVSRLVDVSCQLYSSKLHTVAKRLFARSRLSLQISDERGEA